MISCLPHLLLLIISSISIQESNCFSSPAAVRSHRHRMSTKATTTSTTTTTTTRASLFHHSDSFARAIVLRANSRDDDDGEIMNSNGNVIVRNIQTWLDEISDGWALSYADLSPASPTTPAGVAFLATNLAYAAAGLALGQLAMASNEYNSWTAALAMATELAAGASFVYHYQQLAALGQMQAPAVRLALLVDYVFASLAMGTATLVLFQDYFVRHASLESLGMPIGTATASLVCLGLCWVWEYGTPYMILHGLWHLLSAAAGYLIGLEHSQILLQ